MFLHSGASLHGHEYSTRPRPVPQPGQRRNPLLRSAFATPISRTSSYRTSVESSPDQPNLSPDLRPVRPARPLSEHIPRVPDAVVRFQEPECDSTPPPKPEAMSEDEGSIASDSDASRVSSSVRRSRRRTPRTSTTYLLAHPAPKLRNKQRLIHIRPKLLLQIQQLSANQRPRPAIDVYPSSGVAGSLIVPLLKRFPRIARIKRELSIQDVMLVKSEDYANQTSGSESDADEDDLRSRELLAILSPSRTEDKAEIVLADGTVWIAMPRYNGANVYSYEFSSVDPNGNTTTARWVRKQIATKSLPATPTPAGCSPPITSAVDYKFTFSIIDPNCRRHPIMATLTNSSLDILDTYTTVSQSASRYPPTSPLLSTPSSPNGEESTFERTTQQVEDWQKHFITISAIWVILRHGWSPNCKPADFGPLATSVPTSPTDSNLTARNRSLSMNSDMTTKLCAPEPGARRKFQGALRMGDQFTPTALPRRATSTSAAFMQKRNTIETDSVDRASSNADAEPKKSRRAFSGDWSAGIIHRNTNNSLGAMLDSPAASPSIDVSVQSNTTPLAPPPLSTGRRAISAYYSTTPIPFNPTPDVELSEKPVVQHDPLVQSPQNPVAREDHSSDKDRKTKHQKWRNMANWFRKLHGR
ncbi:hypothetical protein GGS26DRAFT_380167 [Hypomontagnella submonticulosa]|nr:hypothetical protein GGS26DRAFT_380167 [Hypomontagnella submonticulosa]